MKSQLKKLKGQTIKTSIGQLTLKQYYRLDDSQYDQIYYKTNVIEGICKIYDLTQKLSTQRFDNQMQQYHKKLLNMIYQSVHTQTIKIKKIDYGFIFFYKLDKELSLQQCMSNLNGYQRMKLTITLMELLVQLKNNRKIYCNIRPANIYRCGDKFVIINTEYLRTQGPRANMDSFMLESIENNWKYWPSEVTDSYSNQLFDYSLDIYAIGCILYQCITGKYPFQSKLSATNNQYPKLQTKNLISKITQMCISTSSKRRLLNLQEILQKLKQSSNQVKLFDNSNNNKDNNNKDNNNKDNNNKDKQQQQKNMSTQNTRKPVNNNIGFFDNLSNVFSKMMNDSQGWFLNYVQDNQQAPNQKYLDNILTKMYKKQQKSEKISTIIQKFMTNNTAKQYSMIKTLLLIGQAIRKGPQAALNILPINISTIKTTCFTNQQIQSFSCLLQKKIQVNQKFKKILSGNFYMYQINNFKQLTISDLGIMISYLQYLINYIGNYTHADISQLSQSIINFSCDQIYDLVSMIIFSVISIRKDNQLQLRMDKLKQLQPVQKNMNVCLKKLSNFSNFISAHAIYSLQAQYIPYQQQINLKSNPYYTTLQYFYKSCRNYKGLTIPTDYACIFTSSSNRQQKKTVHSVSKQSKTIQSYDSNDKNYFQSQINSDDDDQFNNSKSQKYINNQSKINNQKLQKNDNYFNKQVLNVEKNNKNMINLQLNLQNNGNNSKTIKNQFFDIKDNQQNIKKNTRLLQKPFEQFANYQRIQKKLKSPSQDFNQFLFFNEHKKVVNNTKPPLPNKVAHANKPMEKNFIEFGDFFQQKKQKKIHKFPDFNQIKNNKMTPNFDAFNLFLAQPPLNKKPTQPQNPLVKIILSGLKLKQLKDLIQKNKRFVLDFTQLKIIKVIGSGSAGQVYFGKYKDEDVAIKKVKAKQNPNALKQFQRQLVTYIKIKTNPHLVSLVGLSQSNGDFYLITEFCSSGSLFELLHKKKLDIVLSWKQRLNFALQIAQGMQFLHSMKPIIIHRDLKSLNVLVTKIGNNWKMKVADFGLSRSPQAQMMTTQLGTIHWMAPQLLQGKQYSYKVDIYSYGVLLWQILSRTTPYSNLQNPMAILKYVVIDKLRPNLQNIPKQCPNQLVKVMQKCWAHDPNDRPSFLEVIKQLKMINL